MKKNMKLVAIDAEDIAVLRTNIRAVTADGVRDALGISWDTWNKIAKGHPISTRTRDRLSHVLDRAVNTRCGANDDAPERSAHVARASYSR